MTVHEDDRRGRAMASNHFAHTLFAVAPRRAGDLEEADFPTDPGIYMFTEGVDVMWIGTAAQGIRSRVFHHQLVRGRRSFLPIRKNGAGRGSTRQVMGCSLILHIARERITEPLDMAQDDHRTIWRKAVDRVFDMDVRWLILPQIGAERAAKRLRRPQYGR